MTQPRFRDKLDESQTIDLNKLVREPEVFDGKNPSPREWIEDYIRVIDDNCWTERIAIKYFRTFIKDEAADWYDWLVRPIITDTTAWSSVYNLFAENYLGNSEKQHFRTQLREIYQQEDESVTTFIPRMVKLLTMLSPNMSQEEQTAQIIQRLRCEYQQSIIEYNPMDVVSLRNACRKIESGLDALKLATSEYEQKKSKPATSATVYKAKNCFRCGRNDHLIKDCVETTKVDGTSLVAKPVNTVKEDSSEEEEVHTIMHKHGRFG